MSAAPALRLTTETFEHTVQMGRLKVRVFEDAKRKNVLCLRWRADGNWRYEYLTDAAGRAGFETATLYDASGKRFTGAKLKERTRWAIDQAEKKLASLKSGPTLVTPVPVAAAPAAVTFGQVYSLVSDEQRGIYPKDTPHRREVKRELAHVCRILGADRAVSVMTMADYTQIGRARIRELRAEGHDGYRGAEITIARLAAALTYLRDEKMIPLEVGVLGSHWKDKLREEWRQLADADAVVEPKRPRHRQEDYLRILQHAPSVEPRLALMLEIGAPLRAGQVRRTRRSMLNLEPPAGADAPPNGFVRTPARGHKKGTTVAFTAAERAAIDRAMHPETGYLRELEAAYKAGTIADYYLFPGHELAGGRLHRAGKEATEASRKTGRCPDHPVATLECATRAPVGTSALRSWFREVERRAGIEPVKGRGLYGLRRFWTDAMKKRGASREAQRMNGGWSSMQMVDEVYADSEREYASIEAMQVRAQIRGEGEA